MSKELDPVRLKRLRMRIDVSDPVYFGKKKIKLRGKDLSNIPKELFFLTELEILDLSPERESCLLYKVMEVPRAISQLINLRVLMLDTNDLFELPSEICLLRSLEKLCISNNVLTNLPHGFAKLMNLRSLHAANNKFIAFPSSICALENLEFLDMSDNRISDVPAEVSQLQNLQTLIMFANHLVGLPEEICHMANLRCLWIGENRIRRLPRNFGNLKLLDWGKSVHTSSTAMDGNPLDDPPIKVCKQGVKAIERYFKSTEEHDY